MATLRDQLASDAAAFVAAADLGESVTYRPRVGSPLSILGLVFRGEPENRQEVQGTRWHTATVFVRNDATLGVTAPSEHGDHVDVVMREGEIPVTCRVTNVVSGDDALWELEVMAT